MCFSKGGILWRFVIKICLIKRSTEVIQTQWQNFLQDPHKKTCPFNIMALFMAAKLKSFRWKMWPLCYFARNRDCGYSLELPHLGSSNRYLQSMFYSRNKKNNVCPCKPHFFLYKSGVWGGQNDRHVFGMHIGELKSKGSDKNVQISSMIQAFFFLICYKVPFCMTRPN